MYSIYKFLSSSKSHESFQLSDIFFENHEKKKYSTMTSLIVSALILHTVSSFDGVYHEEK